MENTSNEPESNGDGLTSKSIAPWNEDEVKGLRAWQECGWVHPFTCCNHSAMTVEARGFVCSECGRVQTWAHRFMLFGAPENPIALLS